ncbi:MAG: hypothetical protein GX322_03790 [Firmicutes bacterium]|nr:hypothetical protein [Bacillota bacterium]
MERLRQVELILEFIRSHPESYASLAVCRRALDPGLAYISRDTIFELEEYLDEASGEEIAAYYSIVG